MSVKPDKAKNSPSRLLSIFLVLFVILLIMLFGLLFTTYRRNSEATGVLNTLAGELAKEERLKSLEGVLARVKANQGKLDNYFIGSDHIVDFIEQIESLAEHTKLELEFTGVNIEGPTGGKYLSIGIKTLGSFESHFYFLSLLEALPFRISLSHVSLNETSADEEGAKRLGIWEGSFAIILLSFIEET